MGMHWQDEDQRDDETDAIERMTSDVDSDEAYDKYVQEQLDNEAI